MSRHSRWSMAVDIRTQNRQSTVYNNNLGDRNSWKAVCERKGSDTALTALLRGMCRDPLYVVFVGTIFSYVQITKNAFGLL
jgi:hypothetical protein